MDRPDREKIAEHLFRRDKRLNHNIWRNKGQESWKVLDDESKDYFRADADQIIALFPDIEELQKWYDKLLAEFKILKRERASRIEEAKREEGERIIKDLNPYVDQVVKEGWQCKEGYALVDPMVLAVLSHWWQALKSFDK